MTNCSGHSPDSNPDKYDISNPNPASDLSSDPVTLDNKRLMEKHDLTTLWTTAVLMKVGWEAFWSFWVSWLNSSAIWKWLEYQFSLRIPNTFIWNANATIPHSGERKSGLVLSPWNVLHSNVQFEFQNKLKDCSLCTPPNLPTYKITPLIFLLLETNEPLSGDWISKWNY